MRLMLFSLLLFFTVSKAQPKEPGESHETGTVVRIIDGDTFELLTRQRKTIRVRMNGIDCPERKQDYYQAAKDALAGFIFKKQIRLKISGRDRNKRVIAMVYCNAANINLEMLQNGYAWHYKKYSDDTSFARAEQEARRQKKGLWKMKSPIPPWEFRKKKISA